MKYNYIILFVFTLGLFACNQLENEKEQLRKEIESQFSNTKGTFALAFVNLADTSQSLMINEKEMFHAASTMKTPVMVELFKQAETGKFSLDDSILVKNEFRSIVDSSRYTMDVSEDSEGELYDLIGKKRTIRALIDDMITMSSNLATNILIEKVGAQNVTQTMRSYGADSILVLRGVEDIKAYEQGLSNRTNAYDLMILFEKLGRGEAVSPAASEEMISILKKQHFNEMIPARLPDSVQVAHKTGWITGVHHDSGLIILPDGRKYVLVLLSKEAPDREKVITMFADISRDIYNHVIANSK
ncbi:MAG: serine hydrolase [Balneolaceae bacterium]|nr:serine hydrolase [Balneolaceae bacterium]